MALKTLTFEEFGRTPYGAQGRAGYQRYLTYIRRRRPGGDLYQARQPQPDPAVDPNSYGPRQPNLVGVRGGTVAPTPSAPQPRKPTPPAPGYDYTGIPPGLLPTSMKDQQAQAQAYINSIINPILEKIKRDYASGLQNAQGATTGYTTALVNELKPIGVRVAETYGALADSSSQGGQALQGQSQQNQSGPIGALSNYARLSGAPESIVNAASARGEQIGRVLAALHTAQASDLQAAGNANQGMADALPGIAALRGLQMLGDYTLQSTKSRNDQIAELQGRIPEMTQQLMNQYQDREFQKAAAILAYGGANQRAALSAATSTANSKRTQAGALERARIAAEQKAKALAATNMRDLRANKLKWQKLLNDASKIYGQPVKDFDKMGRPIGADGKVITRVPAKNTKAAATSVAKIRQQDYKSAYEIAFRSKYGYRPSGNPPKQTDTFGIGQIVKGKSAPGFKPQDANNAYRQVYSFLLGRGIDPVSARIQALHLLQAVGYPVRADLIPKNPKNRKPLPKNKGGIP